MKLLLIISLLFVHMFAAPAYNKLREFKQADGTTFKARANGNQHLNWIESEDGEILKYNKNSGNFEYAQIIEQRLKASGTRYDRSNSKKARSRANINKLDKKSVSELWSKKQKEAHQRKRLSH